MLSILRKVWLWIVLVVTAFFKLPLVADIVEFLGRQSVISLVVGVVAYMLVPTWLAGTELLDPDAKAKLPHLIFISTLLLVGRFSIEGILEVRATLPKSWAEVFDKLIQEAIKAAREKQPPSLPPYQSDWPTGSDLTKESRVAPPRVAPDPITPWTANQEAPG